jgi:hypothetical protein
VISSLGSQMTFLALQWFVLATTGSATKMGIVLSVELAPVAVLGIPSGTVVRGWGRSGRCSSATLRGRR